MSFEELENPAGSDLSRMLHHVTWHPVPWRDADRPSAVLVVGGDADTRRFVTRDLAAADVPYAACADPADIESTDAELDRDAVVLVLPRVHDSPQKSVDVAMRTLRHLLDRGVKARMWVLTQRVHEGNNVAHAPLWGLARVAAAEHPEVFGGVLDVADAKLPVGALASLHGQPVVVMRDGVALAAQVGVRRPGDRHAHAVLGRWYLPDHRWHRGSRSTDGAAARRHRRAAAGAVVPPGHVKTLRVARRG